MRRDQAGTESMDDIVWTTNKYYLSRGKFCHGIARLFLVLSGTIGVPSIGIPGIDECNEGSRVLINMLIMYTSLARINIQE